MAHSLDDKHKKLLDLFEEFHQDTQDGRSESERCRDYYDSKQWTDDEIRIQKGRRQPVITVNRIKPKVEFMLGLERQHRTDPKAFPRTPAHEDAAHSCTDSIRYVCDNNNWDSIRSEAFENMLIEGTGAVHVGGKMKKGGIEIDIAPIHWDRFFYDSKSRKKDFSDSTLMGEYIWMDEEDAEARWHDKKELIEGAFSQDVLDETFDDSPKANWADKTRKRIRVAQVYHYTTDGWEYSVYTETGFLEEPIPSPYVNEDGIPDCAIKARSLFVDRNGTRYGWVKQYLDIQDEINHRRSKALHLLNSRQTFSRKGVVQDVDTFKREISKPDGHVEVLDGEYGRDFGKFDTSDMAMGQFNLLTEAKDEIDSIGVNAAMSGSEGRNMSGRALLAKQQGGQMEIGQVMDALRMLSTEVYRAVWERVKQFWTEERWIRVTDDENSIQWVGLNKQVTLREKMVEKFGQIPPGYEGDPRLEQVAEVQNNVAELDVDIIIDDAPDTVTLQQEQFDMLVQMYQANPNGVPWDMVVEASSLRNKDKLLEMSKLLKEQQGQSSQQQQQLMQAMQQVEAENKQADTHKKHASATRDEAEAMKTMREAQLQLPYQGQY